MFKLKIEIGLVKVVHADVTVLSPTRVTAGHEKKIPTNNKGMVVGGGGNNKRDRQETERDAMANLLPDGWNASVLMGPKWPFTRPTSSSNTFKDKQLARRCLEPSQFSCMEKDNHSYQIVKAGIKFAGFTMSCCHSHGLLTTTEHNMLLIGLVYGSSTKERDREAGRQTRQRETSHLEWRNRSRIDWSVSEVLLFHSERIHVKKLHVLECKTNE